MAAQRLRDWVSYVQNHPDDIKARYSFIDKMPALISQMNMRDNMIVYRISRMYAPGTDKNLRLLEKAADMGNTHAMFDIAKQSLSGETKSPGRAMQYLKKIASSGDSFMQQQSQALLAPFPHMQRALQDKAVKVSTNSMFQKSKVDPSSEQTYCEQPGLN